MKHNDSLIPLEGKFFTETGTQAFHPTDEMLVCIRRHLSSLAFTYDGTDSIGVSENSIRHVLVRTCHDYDSGVHPQPEVVIEVLFTMPRYFRNLEILGRYCFSLETPPGIGTLRILPEDVTSISIH